jgi:hypothetical protein
VVSLGTLLGEEHGVGEVPGCGFISGDHARQLATARGSVWQRIVTGGCQVVCVSGQSREGV